MIFICLNKKYNAKTPMVLEKTSAIGVVYKGEYNVVAVYSATGVVLLFVRFEKFNGQFPFIVKWVVGAETIIETSDNCP